MLADMDHMHLIDDERGACFRAAPSSPFFSQAAKSVTSGRPAEFFDTIAK
jgi:hypothetical protein